MHCNKCIPYPDSHTSLELAEAFNCYFIEKVDTIRSAFTGDTRFFGNFDRNVLHTLSEFSPLSNDEIATLIRNSPTKSCILDPLPTKVLKQCLDGVACIIGNMVNSSLINRVFPSKFKEAVVVPLLNKMVAELVLKNYRPVSNLSFISKLIERAVTNQLLKHIELNDLGDIFQSAYKRYHSTETALVKVQNDLLMSMDGNNVSVLVLLDLSAAFDTVDIDILLDRLRDCFGITGNVLSWFKSYLTGRYQRVSINGQLSSSSLLHFGVPQGSVLGPILFSIYTSPLCQIIERHNLSYHIYADDTQLYMSLEPNPVTCTTVVEENLVDCICDIKNLMHDNKLKLNTDKTDIILIGKPQHVKKLEMSALNLGGILVPVSDEVRNLGVIFDTQLNMHNHVASLCKSSFYHLHRVSQI